MKVIRQKIIKIKVKQRDQRVDEKFQTHLQSASTKALSKLDWFHSFQRKDHTD